MKNNLQQSTHDSQLSSSVPPGYKQTEVGVIPEDWEVLRFSDHFNIYAGGDAPKNSCSQVQSEKHAYPIYANALQNKGLYGFTNEKRTSSDAVTITARGYLGHAEYRDEPFFPIVRLLVLEPDGSLDAKYTAYAINERVEFAIESTGVPQLTVPQVRKYAIAAPVALSEQRAIAKALSDMDALLEGLDRLIAKKRDLKQATMQALLTPPAKGVESGKIIVDSGKLRVESEGSVNSQLSTLNSPLKNVRLPGFEGEWEVKRLGDVADIRSGGTPSTSNPNFWDGGVPWCTPTDITALRWRKQLRDTVKTISVSGLRASSAETIPIHSVIMTSRATIGECAINIVPITTNQGFKNLIPLDINFEFLYYLMTTQKERLIQLCGGSTFLEIGKRQLSQLEVAIPPTKKEQAAIAAVLSDMDAEIEALEQRRDKTANLKQAMMQELLTGRIRLK